MSLVGASYFGFPIWAFWLGGSSVAPPPATASREVETIGDYVRGFVAAKIAIEPIVSSSTRSNDAPRMSPSPS